MLIAALSPDGKKIVLDSNRNRAKGEPLNTSDLYLMNTDGSEQTLLTRELDHLVARQQEHRLPCLGRAPTSPSFPTQRRSTCSTQMGRGHRSA